MTVEYGSMTHALDTATRFIDDVTATGGKLVMAGEMSPSPLCAVDAASWLSMALEREPEHPAAAQVEVLRAQLEAVWTENMYEVSVPQLAHALQDVLDNMPSVLPIGMRR